MTHVSLKSTALVLVISAIFARGVFAYDSVTQTIYDCYAWANWTCSSGASGQVVSQLVTGETEAASKDKAKANLLSALDHSGACGGNAEPGEISYSCKSKEATIPIPDYYSCTGVCLSYSHANTANMYRVNVGPTFGKGVEEPHEKLVQQCANMKYSTNWTPFQLESSNCVVVPR